jgi:hypothetical protein
MQDANRPPSEGGRSEADYLAGSERRGAGEVSSRRTEFTDLVRRTLANPRVAELLANTRTASAALADPAVAEQLRSEGFKLLEGRRYAEAEAVLRICAWAAERQQTDPSDL